MDIYQAVLERHSVRQYTDIPIEGEVLKKLQAEIDRVNSETGLRIRLFLNEPKAFNKVMLKALVKFKGAVNYISIAGPESDHLDMDAGYYGEHLVLFAQMLGLNTCWAMMAGKKASEDGLEKGYRTVISISVGYGENQGVPHKSKPIEDFGQIYGAPKWFIDGIECAMLAPTGINKQGFRFEREGDKVRIIPSRGTLGQIDAGIAKYHFEIGAGKENFGWVD